MARSLLDVATVLAKLDHLVEPGQVSIDLTGGDLRVRVYDPTHYLAILTLLEDARVVHDYEPGQIERQHGVLAGVVVRLIHARPARKAIAA